jgi:hypothetical protein
MKWNRVALVGLMLVSGIGGIQRGMAQTKPVPREPQQNDRRSAIAQINPRQPIQIRVVSQTTVPILASLVTVTDDRLVAPGKSVTFGRLHTSYLSLPIDLQVSLKETPDPNNPVRVFLNVQTSGNEVIVNVRTALSGAGNASQAMNIDQKGGIYLY